MTNPTSLPLSDQQLAEQLAATLDQSQTQLGNDVIAQLATLRRQALQQAVSQSLWENKGNAGFRWSMYSGRQWGALTAMVALCAITLGVGHHWLPVESGEPLLASRIPVGAPASAVAHATSDAPGPSVPALRPVENMSDAYTEDPQMLADWEMLDAIGEDPDAS